MPTVVAVLGAGALALSAAGTVVVLTAGGAPAPLPALGGGAAVSGDRSGNAPVANPGHPITVTGTVAGVLRPGQPAAVDVTIRNDNNQPIVVTAVTAVVTTVTPGPIAAVPTCTADWYSVGSFSGTRAVAKRASTTVSLPITMHDLPTTNQDSCQGATLQLRFTAQARQS